MSPVFLDAHLCPTCGAALRAIKVFQPALLVACGYGATGRRTLRSCPDCGWSFTAEVTEVAPDRGDEAGRK